MKPTPPDLSRLRRAWRAALGVFVVAGLTGVLYRWTVAFGWTPADTFGLQLGNVRHAHSHLMYFGWATPALMALIVHAVEARTGRRVRGAGAVLGAVFACALVAYVPFLLYGYAPAVIGDARLPLSVMAAGLNVFAWYAFAVLYVRATRGQPRDAALRAFDLSVGALVLATVGAWGLPLLKPLGVDAPALTSALTHLFLDVFSEGWFVLGVVGLACDAAARARPARPMPSWPVMLAAAGVPFTFALALPAAYVPPLWRVLAGAGGVLVGAGLLAAAVALGRRGLAWPWRAALATLALKAGGGLVVALTPAVGWAALGGLRVLYLHLMLLGFVSLGLTAAAADALGTRRGAGAMTLAVALLLATLVPLTSWWPATLAGWWVYLAAAVAAPAPVLAALALAAGARAPRIPSRPRSSRLPHPPCLPSSPTPPPPSASQRSPRRSPAPSSAACS